ncbi:MAG: LysM peptidoglycan-binding domain-containing protein [Treponema sp.]|nr:LysM peptidoglycan-binding domain-containing protein [Treponema sp.]
MSDTTDIVQEKTPPVIGRSGAPLQFRFIDITVLIVFISTAFLGLYLFRQDLMRTFETRDMEPAGVIIIRNNIIQRRHEDRVAWDRIFKDSPVYPGDLIRSAELSSATIDIERNEIDLNEYSLIRIQRAMSGYGNYHIELQEGNISVTCAAESSGITLNLMGTQVQTSSGTVLNAYATEEGIAVQVCEGKAEVKYEGQEKAQEISEGAMISFDSYGAERIIPSAVVMKPLPNARFLKSGAEPAQIDFLWNRVNLDDSEGLRLEIAGDMYFTYNYRMFNNLDNSTQLPLNAGRWHWRLLHHGTVLNKGQFIIVDSSGPAVLTPVSGSVFRYSDIDLSQLRFQWADKQGASGYLIEINNTRDFSAPLKTKQTTASSLIYSELEEGTWYWRVMPVFPTMYEGTAGFSDIAYFKIEKTADKAAPSIEIPVIPAAQAAQSRAQAIRSSVSEPSVAVKPEPVLVPRYHTIMPGDTLGRVSNRYYNDPMQWIRIVNANNIANPDLIYPGQVFLIPYL